MGIVELEPIIRIRLIIFLVGYLVLTFVFHFFMRRYLKIEKREGFVRKHINKQHKKIEQILMGIFIILMIGSYFYETRTLNAASGVFTMGIIILGFIAASELIRAYMEWKYLENRKDYILTLSELLFSVVILVIAFSINLFGLFR